MGEVNAEQLKEAVKKKLGANVTQFIGVEPDGEEDTTVGFVVWQKDEDSDIRGTYGTHRVCAEDVRVWLLHGDYGYPSKSDAIRGMVERVREHESLRVKTGGSP